MATPKFKTDAPGRKIAALFAQGLTPAQVWDRLAAEGVGWNPAATKAEIERQARIAKRPVSHEAGQDVYTRVSPSGEVSSAPMQGSETSFDVESREAKERSRKLGPLFGLLEAETRRRAEYAETPEERVGLSRAAQEAGRAIPPRVAETTAQQVLGGVPSAVSLGVLPPAYEADPGAGLRADLARAGAELVVTAIPFGQAERVARLTGIPQIIEHKLAPKTGELVSRAISRGTTAGTIMATPSVVRGEPKEAAKQFGYGVALGALGAVRQSVRAPIERHVEPIPEMQRAAEQIRGQAAAAPEAAGEAQPSRVVQPPSPAPERAAAPTTQAAEGAVEARTAGPEARPAAAVVGKADIARTEPGTSAPVRYALMEADDVVSSHTGDFNPDPRHPQGLQVRRRDSAALREQVRRIVMDMEPRRLGESPSAVEGAPIVDAAGNVVAGNGRALALKVAYKIDKAAPYRDWLETEAARLDLDPEAAAKMRQPVVVRVGEFADEAAKTGFARDSDVAATAALRPSEQATADAERMDEGLLGSFVPNEEGSVNTAANRDFVRAFLERVVPSEGERNDLLAPDGTLSRHGVERVTSALFQSAYRDPALLDAFAESTEETGANLLKALTRAAPRFGQLRARAAKGQLYDLDIGPQLAQAAREFVRLKRAGEPVEGYLQQIGMFEQVDPTTADLMRLFEANKRSGRRLGDLLADYQTAWEKQGDPRQAGLLGAEQAPQAADVLARVVAAAQERAARGVEATPELATAEPVAAYAPTEEPPGRAPGAAPGAEPVAASAIRKRLEKVLGPIRKGRFRAQQREGEGKPRGVYKAWEGVARTRRANDLQGIAHEVGHALQKVLFPWSLRGKGAKARLSEQAFPEEHREELAALDYAGKGRATEGYAEFVRLWLTDRAEAWGQAPRFYGLFERKMAEAPEVFDAMRDAQRMYQLWRTQPERARIRSMISVGEKDPRRVYGLERLYADWVDSLRALELAEREIAGGKEAVEGLAPSERPFLSAWLERGGAGKAEDWVTWARTNEVGERAGKGMVETLEPVAKELDEFRDYAVAQRSLDWVAWERTRPEAERSMSAQELAELEHDAAAVVAESPKMYERVLGELVEYQDAVLDEMIASGLMTKETKAAFRQRWPHYVPFYRVLEQRPGARVQGVGRGSVNLRQPIRPFRGSDRDIVDPFESIVADTYRFLALAQRNASMVKLVKLAEKFEGSGATIEEVPLPMRAQRVEAREAIRALGLGEVVGETIKPEQSFTIFRPADLPAGREGIVRIWIDGKPRHFQLSPELYQAVTGLDRVSLNVLDRIVLQGPASLLRAGATLPPEFIARNPLRDVMTATVFSDHGFKPWDMLRGLAHFAKRDEVYRKFRAMGADHAVAVSVDRDYLQGTLRKALRREPGERVIDALRNPLEALRAMAETTEKATRVGEFARALRQAERRPGGATVDDLIDAAIAARDITIDFSRAGNIGRQVNARTAFFNAAVGGLDKMARTFVKHPGRSTLRAATWITLPTIALYLRNRNDPRYQALPEWEKDLFWIIPTKNHLIRIPKPFELGVIFGAFPERLLRMMDKQDPHAFDGLANSVWQAATPELIPTALLGWMRVYANKRFTGAPVVPEREKRLPQQLQRGPQTTGLARAVGRAVKQSPRNIDELITAYTGGLGRYGAQASGAILERLGVVKRPPKPAQVLENMPLLRGFMVNPYTTSVEVERRYDERTILEHREALAEAGEGRALTSKERTRLTALTRQTDALAGLNRIRRQVDDAATPAELEAAMVRARAIGELRAGESLPQAKRRSLLALKAIEGRLAKQQPDPRLVSIYRGIRYERE